MENVFQYKKGLSIIASTMSVNNISKKDTCPIPAYGTTRYNGMTNFKLYDHKCHTKPPHYASPGSPSPFTRTMMGGKLAKEVENNLCKTSTESSILSVCGNNSNGSNHCTCESNTKLDEACNCLKGTEQESEISCKISSDYCVNTKQIYRLTDTSDTKLVDSYEKLINQLNIDEDAKLYNLDLFEPHPRETRRIDGKNLPPTGYDVTLILPQCVCLTDPDEVCNKVEKMESTESGYDQKSETLSNLMLVPSIAELSWDILQSGMVEKIPEKYRTHLFAEEKDQSMYDARCSDTQNNVCKNTNSHQMHCLHKTFLQKIKK